ncbi:hypothetical protein HAZT_HAZT005553 [Hyalella azteca]|uniref:Stealth protein CR4 conserved region 4 domain-containing protein n=1 Tax=Hyalella azteca TaxID=294128 RepID=A0A6A0H3L1_HYAAZ|nr:hypothetical protein HAZT_HAZT005553 [Hyalella azteca]
MSVPKRQCSSINKNKCYNPAPQPAVSLALVQQCEEVHALLAPLRAVPRYRATEVSDSSLHFKMISSNLSKVITMLDEVRREPRKFVCLNNNLDPEHGDNDMILALLQDTYESLYPQPSSFELPPNYRNRFLYLQELQQWRHWRNIVRVVVYSCFALLLLITLTTFWGSKIEALKRHCCRRRGNGHYLVQQQKRLIEFPV